MHPLGEGHDETTVLHTKGNTIDRIALMIQLRHIVRPKTQKKVLKIASHACSCPFNSLRTWDNFMHPDVPRVHETRVGEHAQSSTPLLHAILHKFLPSQLPSQISQVLCIAE